MLTKHKFLPFLESKSLASKYILYDSFTTPKAAGAVNGTLADVGGARNVTDTNSKISITGGKLDFATGSAENDHVSYPIQTRVSGKSFMLTTTQANGYTRIGWDDVINLQPENGIVFWGGTFYAQAENQVVGSHDTSEYKLAITLRVTNGIFTFIKGGAFTKWTLLWLNEVFLPATVYPRIVVGGGTTVFTADNIKVPKRLWLPAPLASDGFSLGTIQTWGDSLMAGDGGTSAGGIQDRLNTLGGYTTYNGGVGAETSTEIATRMLAAGSKHADPTIIWSGNNNRTQAATIKADIASMVASLDHDNYIILGVLNSDSSSEYTGEADYLAITGLNTDLGTIYGAKFLDVRSWLITQATSPGDDADTANDVPPTSLRSDAIHLNDAGYSAVGDYIYTNINLLSNGSKTDGAGHDELNGGNNKVWDDVTGTWIVSAGVKSCSVLDTGLGLCVADCGSANGIVEAEATIAGNKGGVVVRWQDATNYLIAYHDGTNCKLDKVIDGTPTNVISAAAAYAAGAVVRVISDGTAIRLFYNNAAVGTVQTVANFATATKHGLYSTNTGNTFDNFVVWARGNEGQYSALDEM